MHQLESLSFSPSSVRPDCRFGSKADMCSAKADVCFEEIPAVQSTNPQQQSPWWYKLVLVAVAHPYAAIDASAEPSMTMLQNFGIDESGGSTSVQWSGPYLLMVARTCTVMQTPALEYQSVKQKDVLRGSTNLVTAMVMDFRNIRHALL